MLFVSAKDCTTQPAPDLIIEASNMDEETAFAYTSGPSFDLDAQSTDGSGFATFFNMPVGKTTVTMTHVPTQKAMAAAAANVEVGIITWLGIFPSAL